ncbi:hypothetical protein [Candidatus Clostridium stratigraminis]|uniref:Uncharacterized protein n=1 Tax=Candidatus Clostridium stratigraminis TaxID=3381661 RepID=A0ABW8SYQ0_9CLOT
MPSRLDIARNLARHIGQTVTIFTTSGGESGRGFTGILASVNEDFVRLIIQIGSAPGCALGSCCDVDRRNNRNQSDNNVFSFDECETERNMDRNTDRGINNRFDCNGNTLGAIVDIPVCKIAAFVHNSVGSSGW